MDITERNVLPNCCEEWILRFGQFYPTTGEFNCLPCNHIWGREGANFVERRTGMVYTRSNTNRGFEYLTPKSAAPPILNRCCSTILLEFGPRTSKPVYDFMCPICGIKWGLERRRALSIDQDIYVDKGSGRQFVRVENPVADYLKPLR